MKKRIIEAILLFVLASVLFISCGKRELMITDSVAEMEADGEEDYLTDGLEGEYSQVETICVYVCGAVKNPGIVELKEGSRIKDALEAAGGLADGAKSEEINLAQKVSDGQKIRFPYEGEEDFDSGDSEASDDGLVNINTADEKGLTAIPGIGETRAKAIVDYRMKNGNFKSKEEIMRVSGIKEGTYEKIKDYIKI